ncbi:MAG: MMPL family transporter [bacterium]|nr:MMPL family transporter [bacterium]
MSRLPVRSRALLAFFALAFLAAGPGLLRLRLDNTPDRFFVRDVESLERQASFEVLFGRERRVRIVLEGEGLWTREGLEALAAVERTAAESPAVRRTGGLWSRHRWLLPEWPPEDAAAFRESALADELGRSAGWVSPSGDVATVLVELEAEAPSAEIDELERRVRARAGTVLALDLAGLPVFERAMDESQRRLVTVYLPGLLLLAVLLLWLGFRSFRAAAAPLAFVVVVVFVMLGVVGYAGAPLNMISVVFVPLLFVISLATAVHLQAGFGHELDAGLSARAAVSATLRRKGRAVVWTALTTAIAFGSFAVSPVPPIRSLGVWLAAGLGWMLVVAFGFYPVVLEAGEAGPAAPPGTKAGAATAASASASGSLARAVRRRAPRLARWTATHRTRVLAAFGLLALVAVAGLFRLRRESNLLTYFSVDHPARRAVVGLEAAGLSGAAAELLVHLPPEVPMERRFRDPAGLDRLGDLAAELRAVPGVRGAVGAGDLYRAALADVLVAGEPSETARWVVLGLMQADEDAAARLDTFLADDGRAARVSVLLPQRGPRELDPVLEAVRRVAERAFPEAGVSIEGELPLLLGTQRHLLRTLSVSLALTLLAIGVILVVITRSAAGAARALAPNLWAVLAVFGVMGWAGVPLDSTTVMIAAVVLGLAVDDTLHTLAQLRFEAGGSPGLGAGPDRLDRLDQLAAVLERVAPAHVLTSLVLTAGFAVCAFSDFLPLSRFGALSAAGVVAALAGDLFLLPALLAKRGLR